jgi:hypothetical protein
MVMQAGDEDFVFANKKVSSSVGFHNAFGSHNLKFSWSGNRLELLIVTPTLLAITDPFSRKTNTHDNLNRLFLDTQGRIPCSPTPKRELFITSAAADREASC